MDPCGEIGNPVYSSRQNKALPVPFSAHLQSDWCHLVRVALMSSKQQAQSFTILATNVPSMAEPQENPPLPSFSVWFQCLLLFGRPVIAS